MSVALIGPDEDRRKAVAEALAGPPPEPGSRNKPLITLPNPTI
jgi:hypothetical protein